MAAFEPLYRIWLELRAGGETADRKSAIEAFIGALYELKNVYPIQRLTPRGAPEDRPRFVLGQTALGSADDLDD